MSASAQINSQRERNRNDSLKSAVPITRRAEFQELARGYLNDSSTIVARSASLRRLSDDTLLSGLETAHGEERSALVMGTKAAMFVMLVRAVTRAVVMNWE